MGSKGRLFTHIGVNAKWVESCDTDTAELNPLDLPTPVILSLAEGDPKGKGNQLKIQNKAPVFQVKEVKAKLLMA